MLGVFKSQWSLKIHSQKATYSCSLIYKDLQQVQENKKNKIKLALRVAKCGTFLKRINALTSPAMPKYMKDHRWSKMDDDRNFSLAKKNSFTSSNQVKSTQVGRLVIVYNDLGKDVFQNGNTEDSKLCANHWLLWRTRKSD